MERSPTEIADIAQIEPRLAWSLRLCPPYGELSRRSLAERVCQLAGIPPELSDEETDAVIVCALMTQRCLISTGAPPDWEIADLMDSISGLAAQRIPVPVIRGLAQRVLNAGRGHEEELSRAPSFALTHISGAAFARPLVEAGFVKVWGTTRVGRPPEPPEL